MSKKHFFKWTALLVMVSVFALLLGCGGAAKGTKPEAGKKTVIRWSYDFPANGTMSVVPETFKKLVDADASLKGKVEVKLYPASQLYKPAEALDAVMRGDVEIIGLANWYLSALSPKVTVFDIPFLFKDVNSMNKFLTTPLANEIWAPLASKGIVCLGAAATGPYSVISNKHEIILPQNAKGLKIRSLGDGSLMWMAVGASPVDLPAGDIFISMQRGMIDGADIGPISVKERSLFDVTKFYLDTFVHSTVIGHFANKKWLDNVPDDVKAKILAHIKTAEKKHHEVVPSLSAQYIKEMAQKGAKVHVLTDKEREEWVKAMKPVYDKLGQQVGQEYLKKIMDRQK